MVAMRMGVWTGAAVLCLTSLVAGNMYDVTEKTKVAPATCGSSLHYNPFLCLHTCVLFRVVPHCQSQGTSGLALPGTLPTAVAPLNHPRAL